MLNRRNATIRKSVSRRMSGRAAKTAFSDRFAGIVFPLDDIMIDLIHNISDGWSKINNLIYSYEESCEKVELRQTQK